MYYLCFNTHKSLQWCVHHPRTIIDHQHLQFPNPKVKTCHFLQPGLSKFYLILHILTPSFFPQSHFMYSQTSRNLYNTAQFSTINIKKNLNNTKLNKIINVLVLVQHPFLFRWMATSFSLFLALKFCQ
jgi:hypothetical protein